MSRYLPDFTQYSSHSILKVPGLISHSVSRLQNFCAPFQCCHSSHVNDSYQHHRVDYEVHNAAAWLLEKKSKILTSTPISSTPESVSNAGSEDDVSVEANKKTESSGASGPEVPPVTAEPFSTEPFPAEPGWQQVTRKKKANFNPNHKENGSGRVNKQKKQTPGRPSHPGFEAGAAPSSKQPAKPAIGPKARAPVQNQPQIPIPGPRLLPLQPSKLLPSKKSPQPGMPFLSPSQPPMRPRQPFTLSRINDNAARADFRAQKPHDDIFKLAHPFHLIESDKKKMYAVLEEIGVRFGSYVRPPQSANDRTLLLWGNIEQIAQTIRELNHIVTEPTRHVRKPKSVQESFPKVSLLAEEHAAALDKQLRQEAMKQKYQKSPDTSLVFLYTGLFLWPRDEIEPKELLGPSFEAFDQLRILYDSYILFDDHLSAFKILTDRPGAVEEVSMRMEGIMKEFVARNAREIRVNTVEVPDAGLMRKEVTINTELLEESASNPTKVYHSVPSLVGGRWTKAQQSKWDSEAKLAREQQLSRWGHLIEAALRRLRFYRCRIQMRVLLGAFALTTFRRWPSDRIAFNDFVKEMEAPTTKGRILKG